MQRKSTRVVERFFDSYTFAGSARPHTKTDGDDPSFPGGPSSSLQRGTTLPEQGKCACVEHTPQIGTSQLTLV